MKIYLIDLDNTLVYTDELNNEAYKYAIKKLDLVLVNNITYKDRITRNDIFKYYPKLDKQRIGQLIEIKQEYFINNVNKLKLNKILFNFLNSIHFKQRILWTAAEEKRVKSILKHYKIDNFFYDIIYTKKINILDDIDYICKKNNYNKKDLVFCDNDIKIKSKILTYDYNILILNDKY